MQPSARLVAPRRRRRLPLYLAGLAGLLAVAGASEAAKVYKWVDAEGNVNYSQTAPRAGEAQTIETPQSSVSTEEARRRLDDLTGRSDEPRQNRELLAKDAEDEGALAARRKENCATARRNLEILQNSARVQSKDDAGNLFYLSEEAKQRKLEQTQAQIAEFCS